MNLISRHLLLIVSVLTVAAVSFYVYAVWDLGRQQDRVSELQLLITEETTRQAELQNIADSLGRLTDDFAEIDSRFLGLAEANLLDVVEEIETLAGDIGVSFTTESLEEKQKQNLPALEIKSRFSGSWDQVFLTSLMIESLPFRSGIDKLQLRQLPNSPEVWEAMVDFYIYKLPRFNGNSSGS